MKFNWEQKNTVNVITGVLIFTISILCYFIFSKQPHRAATTFYAYPFSLPYFFLIFAER